MRLSERMVALRKERGITQRQLAKDLGLSEIAVQNYESERRRPAHEVMVSLAEYFDVSIDYLVGRTENPNVNDGTVKISSKTVKCPLDGSTRTIHLSTLYYQGYEYTRSNGCDEAHESSACRACHADHLKIEPIEPPQDTSKPS